jgi:hypothetical protein
MSGPTRTPTSASGRQPWPPDQGATGVTCPACGLGNEPGSRVCRNCGLPVASATDPLRGVRPNRVEIAGASRSGLSATVGLAMVVGLLLIGGTLAVSGGGILDSGGRLGVGAPASASPGTDAASGAADPDGEGPVVQEGPASEEKPDGKALGTSFAYTCEDDAIKDLSRSKWRVSRFVVGERLNEDGNFDRITWEMSRRGRNPGATTVTMDWTTPEEARRDTGADLVSGQRAIVVTFDGPVTATVGQQVDDLSMEPQGVEQIRTVDMFTAADGKLRAVIGLRGDNCAKMSAQGWNRNSKTKNGRVFLDVQKE